MFKNMKIVALNASDAEDYQKPSLSEGGADRTTRALGKILLSVLTEEDKGDDLFPLIASGMLPVGLAGLDLSLDGHPVKKVEMTESGLRSTTQTRILL